MVKNMKLNRFLDMEKMRPYIFARQAGVPKNTVYFIAKHGHAPPGTTLATLQGIMDFTKGEVRIDDMVGNGDKDP
jgi:hypothetical protein